MNGHFVNVAIDENRVIVRGKEKASEVCLTFFWNSLCGQLLSHNCLSSEIIITLLIFFLVGSIKPEPTVEIPDLLTRMPRAIER